MNVLGELGCRWMGHGWNHVGTAYEDTCEKCNYYRWWSRCVYCDEQTDVRCACVDSADWNQEYRVIERDQYV